MRAFLLATVVAAGLGLASTAPTLAAPVNGAAIANAVAVDFNQPVEQVRWWRYRYHWRWHRHWHRRWW